MFSPKTILYDSFGPVFYVKIFKTYIFFFSIRARTESEQDKSNESDELFLYFKKTILECENAKNWKIRSQYRRKKKNHPRVRTFYYRVVN